MPCGGTGRLFWRYGDHQKKQKNKKRKDTKYAKVVQKTPFSRFVDGGVLLWGSGGGFRRLTGELFLAERTACGSCRHLLAAKRAEALAFAVTVVVVGRLKGGTAAAACGARIVFTVEDRAAMMTITDHRPLLSSNKKVRQPKSTHRKAQTPIVAKQTQLKTSITHVLTERNLRFYQIHTVRICEKKYSYPTDIILCREY